MAFATPDRRGVVLEVPEGGVRIFIEGAKTHVAITSPDLPNGSVRLTATTDTKTLADLREVMSKAGLRTSAHEPAMAYPKPQPGLVQLQATTLKAELDLSSGHTVLFDLNHKRRVSTLLELLAQLRFSNDLTDLRYIEALSYGRTGAKVGEYANPLTTHHRAMHEAWRSSKAGPEQAINVRAIAHDPALGRADRSDKLPVGSLVAVSQAVIERIEAAEKADAVPPGSYTHADVHRAAIRQRLAGIDAELCPVVIAAFDVPSHRTPDEDLQAMVDNAALFARAGIRILFSTSSDHLTDMLLKSPLFDCIEVR